MDHEQPPEQVADRGDGDDDRRGGDGIERGESGARGHTLGRCAAHMKSGAQRPGDGTEG